MKKALVLFLFLSLFSSCYFGGGVSITKNYGSIGSGTAPSDSEYFYIDLDVDRYRSSENLTPLYEISTTTEYKDAEERDSVSNCEIFYEESGEGKLGDKFPSEENLICILDVMEYEFNVSDIHLVYNFPEGMCDLVEVSLPWHFNHEILPGPVVRECKRVTGTDDEGQPIEEEGFQNILLGAGPESPCVEEEEDLCPAAYTVIQDNDEGAPGCCYGGVKSDGSAWLPDIRCFGGPGLIAEMEGYTREEFRADQTLISPRGGLRRTITLPAPPGDNKLSDRESGYTSVSSPFANYLKSLDRSPDELSRVNRDTLPDFLRKAWNYPYTPKLFFEFTCKDRAGETLHKILMMIREWNTYEEFREFYNEGGDDSADPDVEGTEGDECSYEDFNTLEGEIEECNDLLDFDDIANCRRYAWCPVFDRRSDIDRVMSEEVIELNRIEIDENALYPRISYPAGASVGESDSE